MACLVIAEAGVNHNGDMEMAHRLVDAAADAGADAVKFQTFRADLLTTRWVQKAEYQKVTTESAESQQAMLKKLELPWDEHRPLIDHCARRGIRFLSTPFELESLRFLTADLGLDTIKLPSGEVTNGPLLLAAARTQARIILSTGMASLEEVGDALSLLAWGAANPAGHPPSRRPMPGPGDLAALTGRVTLLHCTTEYPAPFADVNLRAMDTLGDAFGLPVGLSDHTPGIAVALAAVARGARVIEKHFTLDRSLPGPDHQASLLPGELAALVEGTRQIEAALGSPDKRMAPSEAKNAAIARKSLIAARDIKAGESFDEASLTVKRPGTGVSPMRYWDRLGRPANRNYRADEVIDDA